MNFRRTCAFRLSAIKSAATLFINGGTPQFVAPRQEARTAEQFRLMVELRGRNEYGRALLYVPGKGLFIVRPDGTTQPTRDMSCMTRDEGDIIFSMYRPIGAGHTIRFAGPGSQSTWYYTSGESVELTEMPEAKFEVTSSDDPNKAGGLLYRVTLR